MTLIHDLLTRAVPEANLFQGERERELQGRTSPKSRLCHSTAMGKNQHGKSRLENRRASVSLSRSHHFFFSSFHFQAFPTYLFLSLREENPLRKLKLIRFAQCGVMLNFKWDCPTDRVYAFQVMPPGRSSHTVATGPSKVRGSERFSGAAM
jgi:hypothetical protein